MVITPFHKNVLWVSYCANNLWLHIILDRLITIKAILYLRPWNCQHVLIVVAHFLWHIGQNLWSQSCNTGSCSSDNKKCDYDMGHKSDVRVCVAAVHFPKQTLFVWLYVKQFLRIAFSSHVHVWWNAEDKSESITLLHYLLSFCQKKDNYFI